MPFNLQTDNSFMAYLFVHHAHVLHPQCVLVVTPQ